MDDSKPEMALESWDEWLKGIPDMTAQEAADFAQKARALVAMWKSMTEDADAWDRGMAMSEPMEVVMVDRDTGEFSVEPPLLDSAPAFDNLFPEDRRVLLLTDAMKEHP